MSLQPEGTVQASHGIIQFIDSTLSIVHDLHTSHGRNEIVDYGKTLQNFAASLPQYRNGLRLPREYAAIASCSTKAQSILDDVVTACQSIADDLVVRCQLLQQKVFVAKDGPKSTIDQPQRWPREDLDVLLEQLPAFKRELKESILPALRVDSTSFGRPRSPDLRILETKSSSLVQQDGSDSGQTAQKTSGTNQVLTSKSDFQDSKTMAATAKGSSDTDLESEKASLLFEFLLENLGFASMQDREEEVPEAHKRTFEWIFDQSAGKNGLSTGSNFGQWALGKSRDRIYWINGKPGSGKSTLLRFLHGHEKTQRYLQTWAGSKPVVNAVFFFWLSGSVDQRSQTGFLRSLLHQLLDTHRKFIPTAFPDLWASLWAASTRERLRMSFAWPLSQLTASLNAVLTELSEYFKVCLFVDGLDELEGDHQELINIFRNLTAEFSDVKICLSSRPFPVFEKAFGSGPTMKLQDLTFQDMVSYAKDTFSTHPLAGQEYKRSPELSAKLVNNIATKADGVFLWVRLVAQYILENWQEEDDIFRILFRLRRLPTELDDLFYHFLFQCQSKDQTTAASKIFQHIRARETVLAFTNDAYGASLKLWELALADEEIHELALDKAVHEASDAEILSNCVRLRDKIKGCCGGLLEIHQQTHSRKMASSIEPRVLAKSKINYTHRTARDFLMFSGVWDQLLALTSCHAFEPHLDHVRSYVLQMKLFLYPIERHRRLEEWWPDLVLVMTHARFAGRLTGHIQLPLLDELYDTLDHHWDRRRSNPNDNWPRGAFFTYEKRRNEIFHDPFLSLAAKFSLSQYLKAKLSAEKIKYRSGNPLLSFAVEFLVSRRKSIYPLLDPEVVLILLEEGQNPNQEYTDVMTKQRRTPWLYVLQCIREANRRGWINHYDTDPMGVQRWVEIMTLFIEYGANPNATIEKDEWDPSVTGLEVVDAILERYASRHVLKLRNLLVEKGASPGG